MLRKDAENHSEVMNYQSLGYPELIFSADFIKFEAQDVLSVASNIMFLGNAMILCILTCIWESEASPPPLTV